MSKSNKFSIVYKILLSLFFSVTLFFNRILVYNNYIFSSINEVYFKKAKSSDYLFLILIFILFLFLLYLIEFFCNKYFLNKEKNKTRSKNVKIYFLILFIILICWLPYILSYFPGGLYADTFNSLNQATGINRVTNHNPILYMIILKICIKLASNVQLGLELFSILQFISLAAVLSYSVYYLYKKNVSKIYLIFITMFFALFKLFPFYAISIWKDTPFSIALFAYTIFLIEIVYTNSDVLQKKSGILTFLILSFLVSFLRNNGIYIFIITIICILFAYRKKIFKCLRSFAILSLSELLIFLIIQGPVYNYLHLNTNFSENLGVLFQQISYVVVMDEKINYDDMKVIDNICPKEIIKQKYSPMIVDTIKWDKNFNNDYLEKNKGKFFKTWFNTFMNNKKSYVKAYLLNTIGFWNVTKQDSVAYINPKFWPLDTDLIQKDYIEKITGKSIRKNLNPKKLYSSAIFLFISLLGLDIVIYRKEYKKILIYLPALLTWLTIMVAVPLAFSMRYVFILVMFTPIAIVVPFIKIEKNNV